MSLSIVIGNETRTFNADGTVSVLVNGVQQQKGAWRSADDAKDNRIRYTIDGGEQDPLLAAYAFDDNNQLAVTLAGGAGAASDPFTFPGRILIDDSHDLIYRVVDQQGNDTSTDITVYGDIAFEKDTNDLAVSLARGGTTKIVGDSGIASLEAGRNDVAGFNADDLLVFHASTTNTFSGEDAVVLEAQIQFIGTWDIQDNRLKFISKVTGDITKPDVELGFAGKIGAVTAGFEYFADQNGQNLAFNISGQHQWKIGSQEVDFNWESTLGFSGTKFQANVAFDLNETKQNGQTLNITGSLSLQHEDGTAATDPNNPLTLNIAATYAFENNMLVLRANVSDDNNELNYDLQLEGTFQFDGLTLQFGARFTNNPNVPSTFQLQLAGKSDPTSLIHNIALTLDIDESQATAKINLSFELDMRWSSGIRVKALKQAA
jgi:hypothetical protein